MRTTRSIVSSNCCLLCNFCDWQFTAGDEVDHHLNAVSLLPNAPRLKVHNTETTPTKNTSQDEATLRPPRREIIWSTLGFSDLPLSHIYQNYNDLIFNNDTVQLPRRFGPSLVGYRHACSCEGYIREEITLTPDTFQNAVLIYQQPSANERCGLCGELLWSIEEKVNPNINSWFACF